MKKSRLLGACCAAVFSVITLSSHATLTSVLSGQAIYDSDADLTWLANANAAGTMMDWATANAWAAGLTVGGVTGWRLPDTLQPDSSCEFQDVGDSYGYNCTGSEMGNLFYNVLGNTTGSLSNTDPFSNVQSSRYWSSTEYALNTGYAWLFNFGNGYQTIDIKSANIYAWAVQSGNVGAVPVPAAVWLFGSGLLGLIGLGRQRRR